MRLSKQPSRIVGLRIGEIAINLLSPGSSSIHAKFILLKDPALGENIHAGQYTKVQWNEKVLDAFEHFVAVIEEEAMKDLFGEGKIPDDAVVEEDTGLKFPPIPVLGNPK